MAKAPAGLGIAAAAVGLWFLLREIKTIELPGSSLFDIGSGGPITIQTKGIDELLTERTEDLQAYEAERLSDAQRIEQQRAQALLQTQAAGGFTNYGTIPSGITGMWEAQPPAGADRCSALFATGSSSAAHHFYTGKYCREAQQAGFIEPWSGGL